MPSQTSDNRFGSLKWVVHPVAGQGTHTTIQGAITDGGNFAASSGLDLVTIGVYDGYYEEDPVFPNGINYHILALCSPPPKELFTAGNAPPNSVELAGSLSWGTTPGEITFENILWHPAFGITLYNPTTANLLDFYRCNIDQSLGSVFAFAKGNMRFYDCLIAGVSGQGASSAEYRGCTVKQAGGGGAPVLAGSGGYIWIGGQVDAAAGISSGDCEIHGPILNATLGTASGTALYSNLQAGSSGQGTSFGNGTRQAAPASAGTVYNVRSVGSTDTILKTDQIIHVTGLSAGITLTVPDLATAAEAPYVGQYFVIKDADGDASTYNITLDTPNSETIDNASTFVMNIDNQSVTIYNDGTNWFVI